MRKVKILKRDFDAAVKQPWTVNTCLLAQAAKRLKIRRKSRDSDNFWRNDAATRLMGLFDRAYTWRLKPDRSALKQLRSMLPVTIELP